MRLLEVKGYTRRQHPISHGPDTDALIMSNDEYPNARSATTFARNARLRQKLGDHLARIEAGELVSIERDRKPPKPSLHWCLLDKECREFGVYSRVHAHLGGWDLSIAFLPGERFQRGRKGVFDLGGWFQIEPSSDKVCHNITVLYYVTHNGERHLLEMQTCPLRLDHRGGCWDWKKNQRVTKARMHERSSIEEERERERREELMELLKRINQ